MNKAYLNSMIGLTVILVLVALFGTSNHFMAYYNPNNRVAKNTNNNTKPPKPEPEPDPDPNPPINDEKDINGYKCKYSNCQILNGTSVINNKYVFIVDGTDNVILYDIENQSEYASYKTVSISGTSYIAQTKEEKYGVILVYDDVTEMVPFDYTYIEYIQSKDQFVLTKNSSSYVADNRGRQVTLTYNARIINYNDLYIITKTTSGEYHIFNYNNRVDLTEYVNSKRLYIELIGEFVGVLTDGYEYRLYDFKSGNKLITSYQLEKDTKNVYGIINRNNQLEIYGNDKLLKTIDIQ